MADRSRGWQRRGGRVEFRGGSRALGGGIDVLLGIEATGGARWSEVRLGGGHLDPGDLFSGLPQWAGVRVLALDGRPPPVWGVVEVIECCAAVGALVVVDLGRATTPLRQAVLERVDLVVLLAAAQVRDVAAARQVRAGLGEAPVGLVVRRGAMRPPAAAEAIDGPLLAVLGRRGTPPVTGSLPRTIARAAAGIVEGLVDRHGPGGAACPI